MKQVVYHVILYLILPLCVIGCAQETGIRYMKPESENNTWTGIHNRTVLIYMASENNLYDLGFAADDIKEMEEGAKTLPDDVNLILFQDAPKTNSKLYRISKTGRKEIKDYGVNLISTDSNVLKRVVGDVESMYPADDYGLLFWSHAKGWQPNLSTKSAISRSFGRDENENTPASLKEMNIPAMATALSSFPKFNFIMFDACFMQCIEVAYDLKDVTGYIVAAPCEIPGPGAYYNKLVPALFTANPAQDLVYNYYQPYLAGNNADPTGAYGAVIAALDCSQVENFTSVTRQVLPEYSKDMAFEPDSLQMYMAYNSWATDGISPYYDMKGEMRQILSDADYQQWEAALNKLIVSKGATQSFFSEYHNPNVMVNPVKFSGLSGYVPNFFPGSTKWDNLFRKTSWYEAAGWKEKGW